MSAPDSPDTSLQSTRESDYFKFKRIAAWTFVVASPVLIALPPRKLDLNTVALSAAFAVSANHLYRDSNPYGRGIIDDVGVKYLGKSAEPPRSQGIANLFNALPTEKAQEVQARLRASKEAAIHNEDELEKYKINRRFEDRSLPEKIWMGSEPEGWKEKRLREEQKALDEGKGYGDLIMDHIWEVWNWGKPADQKKREEIAQRDKDNEESS
ncbi:hypothetical protein UA08_06959 [Talaromyces atroroseus]|uniref:Uncharacterized protein n=1 Tax=Talaromyces atroroseus TaxID=1441469 RepID=A0A225AFC1_TALAT|nr:hypothetical protein UA08_06959 [Talaromyces atroroseus]OKL57813.1 hypothetical protein UA08_06959 [Talaromyces atroroseus]